MTGPVLGVVAKAPQPGCVKTRLCPPLTPAQAARVAAALLADTVGAACATGWDVRLVVTGDRRALRGVVPAEVPLVEQRGDGLGARLAAAQHDLHALGTERVLLVGADCATLDVAYLGAAVRALDDADVVLGPAHDGGYTLIGSRAPGPELFAGVDMGTDRVLAQTLACAAAAGLVVHLLEPRYDLDTVADLLAARAAGELAHAPRTTAAVEELLAQDSAAFSSS